MSKKIAFTAILLLILGGIIVPVGIVADNYIDDLVSANVSTGLQGIQDEAGPLVQQMVIDTFIATAINISIYGSDLVEPTPGLGEENFFNNASAMWVMFDVPFLKTVANYTNEISGKGDLNYSASSIQLFLYGNPTQGIPGLLTDLDMGTGVTEFLALYDDPISRIHLEGYYNCTMDQLTDLVNWMRNYCAVEIAPGLAAIAYLQRPELAEYDTIAKIAEFYFLAQWCNGSLIPITGFALPLGFTKIYGLEIGYQGIGQEIIPTNMSFESAQKLWNRSFEYSLLNRRGMERWKAAITSPDSSIASYLQSINGLEDGAMVMILDWLVKFESNVMPYLAQYQYSLPTDSATLSNVLGLGGTILGASMIGLSAILLMGNVIAKKPKNSIMVSKNISRHVFLRGLEEDDQRTENNKDQRNDIIKEEEGEYL